MPAPLPQNLVGSYQRYKHDTDAFTTWLSKTAVVCGWTAPEAFSGYQGPNRANTKKKLQRQNSKRAIPLRVQELIRQAEFIASSDKPRIRIPASVVNLIKNAIAARTRCAEWFASTDVKNQYSDETKDESHVYFIQVLQDILDTLKPCISAGATKVHKPSKSTIDL